VKEVEQKEIAAIGARILYKKRLASLRRWSLAADVLALTIPIGYMVFRFTAEGTPLAGGVENVWELLTTALLIIIAIKMVYRWSGRGFNWGRVLSSLP
jgi:hypothetical protein